MNIGDTVVAISDIRSDRTQLLWAKAGDRLIIKDFANGDPSMVLVRQEAYAHTFWVGVEEISPATPVEGFELNRPVSEDN